MNEPWPSGTPSARQISKAPRLAADQPSTTTRSSADGGARSAMIVGLDLVRGRGLGMGSLFGATPVHRFQHIAAQDGQDVVSVQRCGQLDRRAIAARDELAPATAVEHELMQAIFGRGGEGGSAELGFGRKSRVELGKDRTGAEVILDREP